VGKLSELSGTLPKSLCRLGHSEGYQTKRRAEGSERYLFLLQKRVTISFSPIANETCPIINRERVRCSILEIASAIGALCHLTDDPLFPSSRNTVFPIDVCGKIAASLVDISVEVIEKLLGICEELNVVLTHCIYQKLVINDCKYPVALCKVRSIFAFR
jgi:hypothetical protein